MDGCIGYVQCKVSIFQVETERASGFNITMTARSINRFRTLFLSLIILLATLNDYSSGVTALIHVAPHNNELNRGLNQKSTPVVSRLRGHIGVAQSRIRTTTKKWTNKVQSYGNSLSNMVPTISLKGKGNPTSFTKEKPTGGNPKDPLIGKSSLEKGIEKGGTKLKSMYKSTKKIISTLATTVQGGPSTKKNGGGRKDKAVNQIQQGERAENNGAITTLPKSSSREHVGPYIASRPEKLIIPPPQSV